MADKASVAAAIQAAIAEAQAIGVVVPPPPPPPTGTIVKLGLVFGATGLLPWAFGQTFKRGHVPTGSSVVADCAEFQCIPWSYHDDGSVRDAHVAGKCQIATSARADAAMSIGAPSAAPPFVRTALPDVQIAIDGTRISPSVLRVIASGSVMLHEQWVCKLDQQVSVVYETRTFNDGSTQASIPAVENMGFLATSQPARSLALKVTIGGAVTFSETVNVRHHTRIPLLRGSTWSYWLGKDPKVLPDHDRAYLCACESFPPYSPTPAIVSKLPPPDNRDTIGNTISVGAAGGVVVQSYAPNYIGESGPNMSDTGFAQHIGLLARHNIFYLTTGGLKAWNYLMAESYSTGSWPIHFRDETTGRPPLPSAHVTRSTQTNIPGGSGGELGTGYDTSHQPSLVYVAAKVTGWSYFIDEQLHWALWSHFTQHSEATHRQGAKGIIRSDVGSNQDRGAAWGLRTTAQAVSMLSPTDPHFADLVNIWQSNMAYYKALIAKPAYANNLGVIAPYSSPGTSLYADGNRGSSVAWWGAPWMQSFLTASIGYALQMKLPVGAQAQADNKVVLDFSAKLVVGLCGDGSANAFNWRRAFVYAMPWWPDGLQKTPGAWYANFGQVYTEYTTHKGLAAPLSPAPGGDIKIHSTNNPITGADWQTGRPSFFWPALVYAVMHGSPGAQAAFDRIKSSSSWPLIAAGIQNPIWTGMMPPGVKHPGA